MAQNQILIQISGPREPLEVTIDRAARAAYIRVRFGTVYRSIEHSEGVVLDVDAEGRLLGFEVMLPAPAKNILDVADYYIDKGGPDADSAVRAAMNDAAQILGAVA